MFSFMQFKQVGCLNLVIPFPNLNFQSVVHWNVCCHYDLCIGARFFQFEVSMSSLCIDLPFTFQIMNMRFLIRVLPSSVSNPTLTISPRVFPCFANLSAELLRGLVSHYPYYADLAIHDSEIGVEC